MNTTTTDAFTLSKAGTIFGTEIPYLVPAFGPMKSADFTFGTEPACTYDPGFGWDVHHIQEMRKRRSKVSEVRVVRRYHLRLVLSPRKLENRSLHTMLALSPHDILVTDI